MSIENEACAPDFDITEAALTDRLRLAVIRDYVSETLTLTSKDPVYVPSASGRTCDKSVWTDALLEEHFEHSAKDKIYMFRLFTNALADMNARLARQGLSRRAFTIEVTQHISILEDGRMRTVTTGRARRCT